MTTILFRFLIGGLVVSAFAVISDILKPKSFAGLFGAAPSIALATIGLTASANGTHYAALEARSMIAGALGFFVFVMCVTRILLRHKIEAAQQRYIRYLSGSSFLSPFDTCVSVDRSVGESPTRRPSQDEAFRVRAPFLYWWLCHGGHRAHCDEVGAGRGRTLSCLSCDFSRKCDPRRET